MWKEGGSILPNRAASKKALRLEGLWHFGKAKKKRSQRFKTEDKSRLKEEN